MTIRVVFSQSESRVIGPAIVSVLTHYAFLQAIAHSA